MSYSNGVDRYYLIDSAHGPRAGQGLSFHATQTAHEMLDHMIRVLMVRDGSDEAKDKVRDVVEHALKHMDEPDHDPSVCESEECDANEVLP